MALCLSVGLQWAVIQGVAWTGMLVNFSRDGSLIEAVTKTFDGNHPCALCHAVSDGSKKEQKKMVEMPVKKFEAVVTIEVTRFFAECTSIDYPTLRVVESSGEVVMLERPPRGLAA